MPESNLGKEIIHLLQTNRQCLAVAQPGLCRVWSEVALSLLDQIKAQKGWAFNTEAREVDIERMLSHTFIRAVTLGDQLSYLLDGAGLFQHPAYFGLEVEAPAHLLNSRADVLNFYR